MESESPLEVLSRAATMLHREETAAAAAAAVVESSYATNHSRALSLRCSAMEGTVGTVGKWKRERRHRAVCTSPVSPTPPLNSQEPLDMTTTAGSRAMPKERASVIMASPATGQRTLSAAAATGGISDPVIDEHFRRSLGKDYISVFAPAVAQRQQQQTPATAAAAPSTDGDDDDDAGLSAVDDHFAKALGDTWVKLQKEEYQKKRKETATAATDGRQKVNVYAA
ncbi:transcription cofactor vestigial-like protein 4 isoform X4 [Rhopalosiphum maidis]|uniref:transcription cofactor vestigial-like protein 4 isoform X4 n=1 Tax=Rhopalosiphum maidis TaxID=43146 RepID=UPI000EFE3897|nr:transcription cofactor vestigial-like protein 4 isoform X4 [Rhopalosiphum maidis]